MTEHVLVVMTNPLDGAHDAEFNRWYDEDHIPEVLEVPGIESAQRYRLADNQLPDGEGVACQHRYLSIYGLSVEPGEVFAQLLELVGSGTMILSDAMQRDTIASWGFEAIGPKLEAEGAAAAAAQS